MITNSIKISTFENTCSAILLSCEYDQNEIGYSYYIALTTLHLLIKPNSITSEISKLKDEPHKYMRLDIFDSNSRIVNYEIKKVFIGKSVLQEDDIAAILLKIKDDYSLSLNPKICLHNIDFEQKLITDCFPAVIRNEEICNKIYLKGLLNPSYNPHSTMQSYRITDDYHHYSELKDLVLLEGLSGAPVYTEDNMLIGINQSIPYFKDGENPFKTVYFITIKHVLDYLRESGCLLYEKIEEGIRIKWISTNEEKTKDKEDMAILVIGSSGAGKSSFIKSFALHKNFIDASGDGQTTRTDVEYIFSIYEKEPQAQIQFLDKKEFIKKRKNDILLDIISFLFVYRFGFSELDIYDDNLCYFKEIYSKLMLIKNCKNTPKIKEILEQIAPILYSTTELYYGIIAEEYIKVLTKIEELNKDIPLWKMRTIFNNNILEKLFLRLVEYKMFPKEVLLYKDEITEVAKAILSQNPNLILPDKDYYAVIINYVCNIDESLLLDLKLMPNNKEMNNILLKILYNKKGFFSIHEFDFLVDDTIDKHFKLLNKEFKNQEEAIKYLGNDVKYIDDEKISKDIKFSEIVHCMDKYISNDTIDSNFYNSTLQWYINDVFEIFYITIQEKFRVYLENKFYDSIELDDDFSLDKQDLCFYFNDFDELQMKILSKSLKTIIVPNNETIECQNNIKIESLTSIIKKVVIRDSFSNEFAVLFHDLGINSICFLDTHGLDHIEKGLNKKRLLQDFITNKKIDREMTLNKAKRGVDAVFYLKKLDSGKPTELEYIIPMIYDVAPSVSLYCIFTGVDIFYHKQFPKSINWVNNNINNPKSVQYLFSPELKEAMYKKLQFSEERNKSIYYTLTNNIGAFCNISNDYFHATNRNNIKKILISIIIREKDSLDIVSNELIYELETIETNKRLKNELRILLIRFFKKASVSNWSMINGNTAKANAKRINKEYDKQLGYWGVNRFRWDLLFNDAYDEVFSKYTNGFIKVLNKNNEKIEAILINLKEEFLGKSYEIYSFYKSNNQFRMILEKLYKNKEGNPFELRNDNKIGNDMYSSREYLNDVVNFYKLVTADENKDILDEFITLYNSKLIEELKNDRELSINNILKYSNGINNGVISAYSNIKKIFNINDDVKAKEVFKQILKEIFKKNGIVFE